MTARQQWGIVAGILALLALSLAAATRFLGDELFPVEIGSKAPAFRAATLDATPKVKTLADYKGDVVLVNIWATWCGPCEVEMPSIEKLHQEFAPQGLKIVAVSIDDPGTDDVIRQFVAKHKLTFEVLHGDHDEIQKAFQTTGYPETFIIGREGTIRRKVWGALDWASEGNRKLIRDLLATSAISN
jgi:peroxiredoxin